jgi:hypothetical protein
LGIRGFGVRKSAVFAGTLSGPQAEISALQKKVKNGDSVLTRCGESHIVPPANRLLHIHIAEP